MNTQQLVERLSALCLGWRRLGPLAHDRLSVVSIAIMLERIIFFVTRRDDVDRLTAKLIAFLKTDDLASATELLKKSKSDRGRRHAAVLEWDPARA